jgi:hypothetical protein
MPADSRQADWTLTPCSCALRACLRNLFWLLDGCLLLLLLLLLLASAHRWPGTARGVA